MRLVLLVIICIFLNILTGTGQTTIHGIVKDSLKSTIASASIILKSDSTNILAYTYSDDKGKYRLRVNQKGDFKIQFSSLGYHRKIMPISINDLSQNYTVNAVLQPKTESLQEVFIEADRPIRVREDTITFQTKAFTDGTEQTVEDLLKKIPGLQIDSEGTIKVGNKEIEKLMVDGDDFFEKGYKILSKNMPAHPIEEVDIYENYSNNKLLKGIEDSEKVALNLKLSEDAKRIWFGNVDIGYGNDSFYDTKANLMNFGKKNKYYFLTNLNNVGYDATGDINHLIRPMRFGEPASIGDNAQVRNIINLSPPQLNFKRQRTNFNNAELLSLNAIFNPTENIKVKTLGFFNWDEKDFFRNSFENFSANGVEFENTEDYVLTNTQRVGFGKIDITYDISKTQFIKSTTKYNDTDFRDSSNLLFNGLSTVENLNSNNQLFDQNISYTNRFKDKKVLLLTGRIIDEKTPQNYSVNQFLFQDLFETEADNIQQLSDNEMLYMGFNAHLMDRRQSGNLFELQIGNNYRRDKLNTTYNLLQENIIAENPDGFQNQVKYAVNDLYAKSKYKYDINSFSLIGKLHFHQLSNRLELGETETTQSPFFLNPSFGFAWKLNDMHKITSNYSFNRTNAKILDVYPEFVQTGFRSFNRGTGGFNQLDSSSFIFNYQLGNWSNRFFANTFVMYSKNHDFFSTNAVISQNFSLTDKILIKDRDFLNINTNADYYFKKLSTNLKLKLGYSQSEFKNIVNNSDLRVVENTNYNYGLEIRSGFDGWFNFHFGTKWLTSQIDTTISNQFTNNESFLDLNFIFNDKWDAQIQTERYEFGNIDTDNTFYFLDFDMTYKFMKDKFSMSLSGKNLFNTKRFQTFSISDISTSTTSYRLLERYVLLSVNYRF